MSRGTITGKDVVVTGANRGIGLQFAQQLLQRGNRVVAAVRTPTPELQALQAQHPEALRVTALDVASPASVDAWARDLAGSVRHIDVCLNNAGVYGPSQTLDSVTPEDMLSVFATNALGPLLVVQQLRRNGLLGGAAPSLVANVTSKVGSVDDNKSGGGYAYRASKSALNIINKSMSIDLEGQGVTCVLLHPGWVRTRMTNGAGLVSAEESVAGMLAVLEGDRPLNGRWWDFAGKEIPW